MPLLLVGLGLLLVVAATRGKRRGGSTADPAPPTSFPPVTTPKVIGITGPAGIPSTLTIDPAVTDALSPLEGGERMTFNVRAGDMAFGRLEGRYDGPGDPSTGPAKVHVDRIAFLTSNGKLPFGTYTIPTSSSHNYHDALERVVWSPLPPSSVGLRPFADPPQMVPGAFWLMVVADQVLTKIIAVVQVARVEKNGEVVFRLVKPYMFPIEDSGAGPVTFPTAPTQNTVRVSNGAAMVVDPTSIADSL